MSFRASFCHPFQADSIEMGEVSPAQIVEFFHQIPWLDFLRQIEGRPMNEVHYSPSLEVEDLSTHHGISISVARIPDQYEFYLFYKRPKRRRYLLGLVSATDADYTTQVQGQTLQQVTLALQELLRHAYDALEQKVR